MPGASGGSFALFAVALVALDAAAVIAAREVPPALTPRVGVGEEVAFCQTQLEGRAVSPAAVAITYLDSGRDIGVEAAEVRAWFGELDPAAIDVYQLEQADGHRRVAFELQRGKWDGWDEAAAGARGAEVCERVRQALHRRRIGRPAPAGAEAKPPYAFEFIYARRPHLYRSITWVGTLGHVLVDDRFAAVAGWLEGPTAARWGDEGAAR